MGLTKNIQKRKKTGGKRKSYRKSRRFEKKRTFSKTKLSQDKKIQIIRSRGGNYKRRLLRTNDGYFTWLSQGVTKRTRIIDVAYSSSSVEFIRTKTLVKGIVVLIDVNPFRRWYKEAYGLELGKSKASTVEEKSPVPEKEKKPVKIREKHEIDAELAKYCLKGKVLALITSSPGQCGQIQGRILEGNELHFYVKHCQRKRLLK